MRLLIVEDEVKIAAALKRGLEQEGFAVDVQHTGNGGKSYALTEPYDVVILDRMLPGIADGLEICAAMREKGIATPVLMLTARDQVQEKVDGLKTGADDYLTKPFAFEEFVARVQALLRRPKQLEDNTLTVGDVELDTINHRVTRAGKDIALSVKEFALLEYLMRNAGRTVSKEQIIEHVWDFDADILPNTVEVYIRYLRNKLEQPFKGKPLIHTARGFGYSIRV